MNFLIVAVLLTHLSIDTRDYPQDISDTPLLSVSQKKLRKNITTYALSFLGTAYNSKRYSKSGFDCSGFVQHIYGQHGIALARSSKSIATQGKPKKRPQAGDLAFFSHTGRINHVGIVSKVQGSKVYVVHSTSSKGVIETCINESEYWQKRFAFVKDVLSRGN